MVMAEAAKGAGGLEVDLDLVRVVRGTHTVLNDGAPLRMPAAGSGPAHAGRAQSDAARTVPSRAVPGACRPPGPGVTVTSPASSLSPQFEQHTVGVVRRPQAAWWTSSGGPPR